MPEIEISGKKYNIVSPLGKSSNKNSVLVPKVQQPSFSPVPRGVAIGTGGRITGDTQGGKEGVYISTEYYRNDLTGKPYPGRINFNTQRVLAYNSTVVRSILTLRAHQVAKLPIKIKPKSDDEPPRQVSILDYVVYDLENHPAFDEDEQTFLTTIYERLDPTHIKDKKKVLEDGEVEISGPERSTLRYLQKKHDLFYKKRARDIKKIKKVLGTPDPWFTDTRSWERLLKSILGDLLILDRGAVIILRDNNDEIRGLMPVDGATLLPLVNEYGTLDPEKAYVQVVHGSPRVYLKKRDVVIFMMNPLTDLRYFGYGLSNMETLYTDTLADIFIDKGQLDFYRKGGSIPEGLISIEPPPSRDGAIMQIDQEQLETIQRQFASLMSGDYSQVPIISGAKVNFIDFKGKHRDMQYKELAEYLSRKICAVMQVSPQDVGITSDVNRATSETMNEMTKSKGLETLMRVISEYFTQYIISEIRKEDDLMLWFEDADIDKEKAMWTIDQQKIVSGVLSINQWRAAHGKYPVPWGHTPLQGLRSWKPEDDSDDPMGGLPPLPGMGGPPMPPSGGLPPDLSNPGGPVGGDNPMAGMPPMPPGGGSPLGSPTNIKSMNFFHEAHRLYPNASPDEIMVKGFADMYLDNSNISEFLELQDIVNYPGGEWVRSPAESYEYFVKSNPQLNVVMNMVDYDEKDTMLFSNYDGSGVVTVDSNAGQQPLMKSLSEAIVETLSEEKRNALYAITGEGLAVQGVERAVFKSLDTGLHELLYQDLYKFSVPDVTDAQVEEIAKILETS